MKKNCKFCWAVSLALLLVLGIGAYKFLIVGSVEPYADGRTSVLLLSDERNKILGGMRGMLEAVQTITEAAAASDMKTVSDTARSIGLASAEAEPASLIAKLPLEFMTLGMGMHRSFDDLADLADSGAKPLAVLGQLSEIMLSCTACHASYRLGIEGESVE